MSLFLLLMSLLATKLMQNGAQCLYHLKQCEIASPSFCSHTPGVPCLFGNVFGRGLSTVR